MMRLDAAEGGAGEMRGTPSGSWSSRDKILIAHATVASVALLLLSPTAILIARWFRGKPWFPAHAALNMLSGVLIIVALALGSAAGGGDGEDTSNHQAMGVALLVIALIQIALGIWAHFTRRNPRQGQQPAKRFETARDKSFVRYGHIVLGLAVVGLGYAQVHSGFELWPSSNSRMTDVPLAVKIIYWILLGLFAALYVLGWLVEARKPKLVEGDAEKRAMTASSTNSA